MPAEANGNDVHSKANKAIPFQGKQPYGMPPDMVIPNVMDLENTDERLWVRTTAS